MGRSVGGFRSKVWPQFQQQGNEDLKLPASCKWILPRVGMSLEADSLLEPRFSHQVVGTSHSMPGLVFYRTVS